MAVPLEDLQIERGVAGRRRQQLEAMGIAIGGPNLAQLQQGPAVGRVEDQRLPIEILGLLLFPSEEGYIAGRVAVPGLQGVTGNKLLCKCL